MTPLSTGLSTCWVVLQLCSRSLCTWLWNSVEHWGRFALLLAFPEYLTLPRQLFKSFTSSLLDRNYLCVAISCQSGILNGNVFHKSDREWYSPKSLMAIRLSAAPPMTSPTFLLSFLHGNHQMWICWRKKGGGSKYTKQKKFGSSLHGDPECMDSLRQRAETQEVTWGPGEIRPWRCHPAMSEIRTSQGNR